MAHDDRHIAYVLNTILGGSMSSRLFQEIREKHGLAYTVYSSLSAFMDTGLLSVYVATSPTQVPTCLKLIEEAMRRLTQELLTDQELSEVKASIKGGLMLSDDSVEARMSSMGRAAAFAEPVLSVDQLCKQIENVSAADIRRVARRLLRQSSRSILVMGPMPAPGTKRKLTHLKPIWLKK